MKGPQGLIDASARGICQALPRKLISNDSVSFGREACCHEPGATRRHEAGLSRVAGERRRVQVRFASLHRQTAGWVGEFEHWSHPTESRPRQDAAVLSRLARSRARPRRVAQSAQSSPGRCRRRAAASNALSSSARLGQACSAREGKGGSGQVASAVWATETWAPAQGHRTTRVLQCHGDAAPPRKLQPLSHPATRPPRRRRRLLRFCASRPLVASAG